MPKESNNPGEKVRKRSGDLEDTKQALVTTTDTVFKEGNTEVVDKEGNQNKSLWRNPSIVLFQKRGN